jgi:Bifunctional DNA primase/polymerase, N-terminal
MTVPLRFGSHAAHVHKNGWLPIVPVYGKSGLEQNWPMAGWEPPTREAVQRAALRHPTANIGLVMDGKTVVIDVDQPDWSMSAAIADLAEDVLGYTPFVRVGSPPKWCRFYRADGLVPTTAGSGVEIFSAVGSKQVVLYGRHPSGREYAWVGDAEPLTHGWSEVPVVAARALSDFRSEAIALCAGQVDARPSPSMRPASLAAYGGSVSELMIDLFSLFSDSESNDRLAVAGEFLGNAVRGMRNNTLAATVSCLVLSGYSDRQIVMGLREAWSHVIGIEDPGLRQLRTTPAGIRRRMGLRGAAVRPVEDLDADLDGGWGVFD